MRREEAVSGGAEARCQKRVQHDRSTGREAEASSLGAADPRLDCVAAAVNAQAHCICQCMS